MTDLTVLKLGGSLLTHKGGSGRFRASLVVRLAREIARAARAAEGALLLGHGAGSFGHVPARRYGVGSGPLSGASLRGAGRTQDGAARLHRRVMEALLDAGAPVFSVPPSGFVVSDAGKPRSVRIETLAASLDAGLVPVVFGDVVADRSWGASICSTETVFAAIVAPLARAGYGVTDAVWMGTTDGVYDARGETIPEVDARVAASVARARASAGGSAGVDVTGGMEHRLETAVALARRGVRSHIVDGRRPGILRRILDGATGIPGTRVDP